MSNSKVRTHKDLDVWNKAIDLAEKLYRLTGQFPKEEMFGLVSQVRRAAISIPSNIAEGAARNSNKEFAQFLYVAMGSLAEIETQLLLAKRLNFLDDNNVFNDITSVRKMILGLINFVKRKKVNQ